MRGKAQGLTAKASTMEAMIRSRAAVRSRLRAGLSVEEEGVSPRKQVGDAVSVLRMEGRGYKGAYEDEL